MTPLSFLSLFLVIGVVLSAEQNHEIPPHTPLSNQSLLGLPSPGNDFNIYNGAILSPILRPRVAGSKGIEVVRQHFVRYFRKNLPKWEIIFENSTQRTALKRDITFSNLILRRDPPFGTPGSIGRLSLVAHYDSKMTPIGYIGAIDSAAPCAMLIHMARSIDSALTKKWEAMELAGNYSEVEQGIEILFMDGEEPFIDWGPNDSLYGSKVLADRWANATNPALSKFHTAVSSIKLFVLLDLLGSALPSIPSYYMATHWSYQRMALIESRLRGLCRMRSSSRYTGNKPWKKCDSLQNSHPEQMWLYEKDKTLDEDFHGGQIQDDHIPFVTKGIEVLHIIPLRFPEVWHEPSDTGKNLDMPTVLDWAQIVTVFAAEWMDLEGYMPKARKPSFPLKRSEDSLEENSWDEELEERDELFF